MAPRIGTMISDWYLKNQRSLPWRVLWSKTKDPYVVWISEIFLQQTQIATVIPKYNLFIKKYPNIVSLIKADEDEFKSIVSGMGYYRRFANILKAAKYIQSNCSKLFPKTYDSLLEVPGIGPYTASAIASICFEEPQAVLDGNVERVLCRLCNFQEPPNLPAVKKKLQLIADSVLDGKSPGNHNQGIMELGQLVCKPTNPQCHLCPVKTVCKSYELGTQSLAPAKKIRKEFKKCYVDVYVPRHVSKNNVNTYGIVLRGESFRFLKNTKGFYLEEVKKVEKVSLGYEPTFKHTITHNKIVATVIISSSKVGEDGYEWHSVDSLKKYLQTSFDKKVLDIICSRTSENG